MKWYCVRCGVKLNIETDVEPAPIRKCDGCGIVNHVRPMKGEAGESNIPIEDIIEQVGIEVVDDLVVEISEPVEEAVIEAEGLTDGQAEVLEELIEFAEKEPLIESITIEGVPDNETMSLDAQIAELQAKKDALEAGE